MYRELRYHRMPYLDSVTNSITFRKACGAPMESKKPALNTNIRAAIVESIKERTGETDSEDEQEWGQERGQGREQGQGQVQELEVWLEQEQGHGQGQEYDGQDQEIGEPEEDDEY
jgi:hypothetical protein